MKSAAYYDSEGVWYEINYIQVTIQFVKLPNNEEEICRLRALLS